MSSTCKVEHRCYVASGWVSLGFCDARFYGEDSKIHERNWHSIEFKKYHGIKDELNALESKKLNLEKDRESILKAKKNIKWFIKILKILSDIDNELSKLDEEISKKKKEMFYDAYDLHSKIERYLDYNGFSLINCSSDGKVCETKTEVWQKG